MCCFFLVVPFSLYTDLDNLTVMDLGTVFILLRSGVHWASSICCFIELCTFGNFWHHLLFPPCFWGLQLQVYKSAWGCLITHQCFVYFKKSFACSVVCLVFFFNKKWLLLGLQVHGSLFLWCIIRTHAFSNSHIMVFISEVLFACVLYLQCIYLTLGIHGIQLWKLIYKWVINEKRGKWGPVVKWA